MKKTLLTILAIISLGLSSIGQTFTTMSGDTAEAYHIKNGETVDPKNHITNVTSSNIIIKWRLTNKSIPTGWLLTGFCDNTVCHTITQPILDGTSTQVSPTPYVPNVAGLYYAQFDGDAAPNGSSAWIQTLATDTTNNVSKTVTFVALKGALGVVNINKFDDDVVLYPNPAKGSVNVVFDGSLGVKTIAIYNLIGKAISVYKVNGNSAKLELDEIPSGIYFVRLINSQGKIVATRKFTHQ